MFIKRLIVILMATSLAGSIAGCGNGGERIAFEPLEGISQSTFDLLVEVLRGRMETTGEQELFIEAAGTSITVGFGRDLTVDERSAMIELLTRPGEVTFRPVIESNLLSSPAFLDGTLPAPGEEPGNGGATSSSQHAANLDPETGLTIDDDPTTDTYLIGSDGVTYYHLGPAFLDGRDFRDADAAFTGGTAGPGEWVVDPEFTDEGGETFRAVTGMMAQEPVGSPTRSIAVVLDGVVVFAPAVAAEVGPEGLDPDNVIITIGRNAQEPEAEARNLAAILRYGALPVELIVKEP